MKPFITRSDIVAAECRLAQTKRESRVSFVQLRSAIGLRLAQPSSLLVVTGLGAVLGVWFARRNESQAKQEGVSAWAPILGVVFTLLIRFSLQRISDACTRPRTDATPDHPVPR